MVSLTMAFLNRTRCLGKWMIERSWMKSFGGKIFGTLDGEEIWGKTRRDEILRIRNVELERNFKD